MRLLVFIVCVLVGLAVVECKCDRVYWFSSMNKMKLDTLQRKLESAAKHVYIEIQRRGHTVSVCKAENSDLARGFRYRLLAMERDSPWLQMFGLHDDGDTAAKVERPFDTEKELTVRHMAYATWHELLSDICDKRLPVVY